MAFAKANGSCVPPPLPPPSPLSHSPLLCLCMRPRPLPPFPFPPLPLARPSYGDAAQSPCILVPAPFLPLCRRGAWVRGMRVHLGSSTSTWLALPAPKVRAPPFSLLPRALSSIPCPALPFPFARAPMGACCSLAIRPMRAALSVALPCLSLSLPFGASPSLPCAAAAAAGCLPHSCEHAEREED